MKSQKGSEHMGIKIKDTEDFKQRLMKIGHTQTSFAEKVNLSTTYLNKAVNGERTIGAKAAGKIQGGLKAKFDELFIIEKEEVK
jgi:transcriptional regulator with XRE-family HTH domain